jgi:four helix bundle protein
VNGQQLLVNSQARRAATSVTLNIAEGSGCGTGRDFARFLTFSYRSLKEVEACLELCRRLHAAASEPAESP